MKRRRYKKDHRYDTIICPSCKRSWSQTVKGGTDIICRFCANVVSIPHLLKLTDKDMLLNSTVSRTHFKIQCNNCGEVFRVKRLWTNHNVVCLCGKTFRITQISDNLEQNIAKGTKPTRTRKKEKRIKS